MTAFSRSPLPRTLRNGDAKAPGNWGFRKVLSVPLQAETICQFEGADDGAEIVTLSCGLSMFVRSQRETSIATYPPVPVLEGHLEYGTGGGRQAVDFDWLQGTLISFPCSSFRVDCKYVEVIQGDITEPIPAVTVTANASLMARGTGHLVPQLTKRIGPMANGASVAIPVPAYASDRVRVWCSTATATLTVEAVGGPVSLAQALYPTQREVDLPNGTSHVAVTNTSGVDLINVGLIFPLAL